MNHLDWRANLLHEDLVRRDIIVWLESRFQCEIVRFDEMCRRRAFYLAYHRGEFLPLNGESS
jgi:hypothetical protein